VKQDRIGVYPGTFDPVTHGHLDIVERALMLLDRLVVAVAVNDGKSPLFTLDERVEMLQAEVKRIDPSGKRVEVKPFEILLMRFTEQVGATIIVRGLRAVSDFDYEFQMAGMNQRLNPKVETVFLMASEEQQFIASRFVKEIARLGGEVTHFVPERVAKRLKIRLAGKAGS
jgi:pantetheine-phosphate adenylyltransferase